MMTDLESYIIDCMNTSWENAYIYAFPKFSMRWSTINKIEKEAEKALIIVPMWPKQTWFTGALELATATPVIVESRHLHLPGTNKQLPLCPKLKLMGICYSRNKRQQFEFRNKLTKPSLQPGHHRLNASTNQYSKSGRNFVVKGVSVPCRQMK